MKTIILSISIFLTAWVINAQTLTSEYTETTDLEGVTITVNVPVKSSEGTVLFGLYDESTFMVAPPLQALESEIKEGKATVTFVNVRPGIYAVTLFHDKNGNKQMDFEPNGMPIEMYGASNNVLNYGPPQWNDSKFEVNEEPLRLDIIM